MDDIPTDEPPASEGTGSEGMRNGAAGSGADTVRRPDGTVLRPVGPESETRGAAADGRPMPDGDA